MEQREEISKGAYVSLVWFLLFVGLSLNAIFSTILIMKGWNYYLYAYSTVACILTGFAIGLSYARAFKIKGLDK